MKTSNKAKASPLRPEKSGNMEGYHHALATDVQRETIIPSFNGLRCRPVPCGRFALDKRGIHQ